MKNPKRIEERIKAKEAQIKKLNDDIMCLKEELDAISRTHVKCNTCGEYYEKKSLPLETYDRTKVECIQRDCGYGDDDVLAEVTRHYCVQRCPQCHCIIIKNSVVKSVTNRRTRR